VAYPRVDGVAHGGVLEELLGETNDEDGAEEVGPGADGQPVAHIEDILQQWDADRLGQQRAEDEDAEDITLRLRLQPILLVEEDQP